MASDLIGRVRERLFGLVDEETTRKFGELNIITDVSQVSDSAIIVRFRPLSPYSPIAVNTGREIKAAALGVEGVSKVRVECSGHMLDDLVNRLVNRDDSTRT